MCISLTVYMLVAFIKKINELARPRLISKPANTTDENLLNYGLMSHHDVNQPKSSLTLENTDRFFSFFLFITKQHFLIIPLLLFLITTNKTS